MNVVLQLRPVRPDDEPFLRALRGQIDAERLGLQYWAPEQAALAQQLTEMQFRAHHAHYKKVKSRWDTKDCVIELGGETVGRFIVTQDAKEVYLADLAVHRDHRGKGLGQAVIDAVKAECVQSKRVLRLHVDAANPAVQFYAKLGFVVIEQLPTHFLMEWTPPTAPGKTVYFSPGPA